MVALEAKDEAQVQRLYDIALANGGSDEGAPGDRGGGFYAGYFRDPDGNKLNAFVMKAKGGRDRIRANRCSISRSTSGWCARTCPAARVYRD